MVAMDASAERIAVLLDKQDIYECLMRYCRAIDRCDEELLRTVYHDDARDDHGSFNSKAADFIPWVMKGLRSQYEKTTHAVSNILIEVDGDVAWCESYINSYHLGDRNGARVEWIFGGRYVDRFERRDGAWKIAHRVTVFDWESLRPEPEEKVLSPDEFSNVGKRSREDAVYAR